MRKLYLSLIALAAGVVLTHAQLTVTTGLDTVQLANLLTGLGVNITNVQINCNSNSYGEFSGTSEIPINHGLMMTTGYIDTNLLGPNNSTSYGTDNIYGGDADLTTDCGIQTFNACVLEFDCIPAGDTLMFNFGFGSEEYPEYVGSSFNDIFAIYFSDSSGIPYNAAFVPSTTIPVSINNVNHLTNSSYYIDNSAGVHIQFDGITQNLQAFAVVIPGNTYHFKVAIADAGDGIFDSGVLLEAFSFRSTPITSDIQMELASLFAIYPVPANEVLQIQSKSNTTIEGIILTDMLGKVVVNENVQSTSTALDVSNLKGGLYMLTVQTPQGSFTKKILVN